MLKKSAKEIESAVTLELVKIEAALVLPPAQNVTQGPLIFCSVLMFFNSSMYSLYGQCRLATRNSPAYSPGGS